MESIAEQKSVLVLDPFLFQDSGDEALEGRGIANAKWAAICKAVALLLDIGRHQPNEAEFSSPHWSYTNVHLF